MEKHMIDFTDLNIEELSSLQDISEDEMASVAYLCTCTCTGKAAETTAAPTGSEQ
jgi:hypothetical protein